MGTQAIGLLKIPINYFICVNDTEIHQIVFIVTEIALGGLIA